MSKKSAPYISLAPFQGITTKVYRDTFVKHFPGYDAVYSPFISGVDPLKPNISKFRDVLPVGAGQVVTVPQFVSTDAAEILQMAHLLHDSGYEHINWNMGCPFPRLANKMRGCGILPFPDEIRRLLDEVMPVIPLKLSIKTRLGYHSLEEAQKTVLTFNDYPLHEIIVHPRTGKQLYRGETELHAFGQFLISSNIPIAFNGDIFHATRWHELQQRFPAVRHWMVGRGALINPFLAATIKGIAMNEMEKKRKITFFVDDLWQAGMQRGVGERVVLGGIKAVVYYLCGMFSHGSQVFDSLKTTTRGDDFIKLIPSLLELPMATDGEIENYFKFGLKHK